MTPGEEGVASERAVYAGIDSLMEEQVARYGEEGGRYRTPAPSSQEPPMTPREYLHELAVLPARGDDAPDAAHQRREQLHEQVGEKLEQGYAPGGRMVVSGNKTPQEVMDDVAHLNELLEDGPERDAAEELHGKLRSFPGTIDMAGVAGNGVAVRLGRYRTARGGSYRFIGYAVDLNEVDDAGDDALVDVDFQVRGTVTVRDIKTHDINLQIVSFPRDPDALGGDAAALYDVTGGFSTTILQKGVRRQDGDPTVSAIGDGGPLYPIDAFLDAADGDEAASV